MIRKLLSVHSLSEAERAALTDTVERPILVARGSSFVLDGEHPEHLTVVISGIACRQKHLEDGRRQILALHYAGDMVDLYGFLVGRVDHSIHALSNCTVANIRHSALAAVSKRFPNVQAALAREMALEVAIAYAWLVNAGQRRALERLANFICEQHVRMEAAGLVQLNTPTDFPLTQTDVADATGLSLVHVNKRLQNLREMSLIGRGPNQIEILNWKALKELGNFEPRYLHLKQDDHELSSL